MKALVIAPQPFFSPRGTPFSVYYRTLVSSELDVEIDLLTYGEGQDVQIPGVRIIRIPRFKMLGNIKVGPSYFKAFLNIFMIVWTIALLLRNKYDFVHAHEEAVFFCSVLKPIFGFKLIYDMHSSLPQQLTNFRFTRSKIIIGLFGRLEDTALRMADAVITICPDLSNYARQIIPDPRKEILIENSIFEPVKLAAHAEASANSGTSNDSAMPTPLEATLPDGKKFVVYAGTLEPYQGIDILVRAFKKVASEHPESFLVIVGGSETQVEFYSELAERMNLDGRVLFTGQLPQHLAQQYCRRASVQISCRKEGTNTPLKVYEQLASGIPILATNIYSHTQVLNENVAFLVEPEPEEMAKGISAALLLDGNNKKITESARRLYEEKFARPVYVQKMRRVMELLS
jgi:glycosyltransferase involved in cell wall biosynthesis